MGDEYPTIGNEGSGLWIFSLLHRSFGIVTMGLEGVESRLTIFDICQVGPVPLDR
jgi:hypothetical protein